MPRTTRLIALAAIALFSACSNGATNDDDDNGGGAGFTAKIDGVNWSAATVSAAAQISGVGTYSIVGGDLTGTSMSIILYNITGPGTYPLGVGGLVFGGTAVLTVGSNGWSTPLSGSAGTVTITTASATRIVGTFSFTAAPTLGTAASKVVTNGSFDLAVTGSGNPVVPDQYGSKVSGTINSADFNAATVVFGANPSSGTLALGLSNNVYSINLIISAFAGVGTYTMGTASGAVTRTISVTTTDGTSKTWGYTNAATSGTFTVTSSTATRLKGSYNITALPFGSTTGNATLVGTFDIGLYQLTGLRQ